MQDNTPGVTVQPPWHATEYEIACLSAIFSQELAPHEQRTVLTVNPGFTEIRQPRTHESKPPDTQPKQPSKRQQIRAFSKKSRLRCMKTMASMREPLKVFDTLTFPDEFFTPYDPADYAKVTAQAMKRFKYRLQRHHPDLWGMWRREWVHRKSGSLAGTKLPHFHGILGSKHLQKTSWLTKLLDVHALWVESLLLDDPAVKQKALSVNTHYAGPGSKRNAFEWMNNQAHAQRYISKYLAKVDNDEMTGSIGRNWGVIGNPPIAEGIVIEIPQGYAEDFKRFIRRYIRPGKKTRSPGATIRFRKTFARKATNSFIFINASTVTKLLDFIVENHTPF